MFEELFYLLYQYTGVNTFKKAGMFTISNFGFLIQEIAFQLIIFYVSSFALFPQNFSVNISLYSRNTFLTLYT